MTSTNNIGSPITTNKIIHRGTKITSHRDTKTTTTTTLAATTNNIRNSDTMLLNMDSTTIRGISDRNLDVVI